MAVYVDELFNTMWADKSRWRHNKACHLWGDTDEELHKFAAKIGLLRRWFQDHPRLPHYDLTAGKRREAVAAGAVETRLADHIGKKRKS